MADDMIQNGAVSLPVVSMADADRQKKIDDLLSDNPDDPMNDTKRELRTRFELLPEEVQKVIVDDSYQANLLDIARRQKLTYEELGTLEIETTMVLLGMTKPDEYRDEVMEELKKNDAETDAIVKDVSEKIFAPVRAQLEKIYSAVKDPIDYLKENNPEVVAAQETASQAAAVAPLASAVAPASPVQTPAVAVPSLTAEDKATLEKTGVVITDTAPRAASTNPMTMPSRTDVLKGIENPPKAPAAGFVSDKLKAATPVMPTMKMTDYSVPKPAPAPLNPAPIAQTPAKPAGPDPYREPIN